MDERDFSVEILAIHLHGKVQPPHTQKMTFYLENMLNYTLTILIKSSSNIITVLNSLEMLPDSGLKFQFMLPFSFFFSFLVMKNEEF